MPKVLSATLVIKLLKQNGFLLKRTSGSHYVFFHPLSRRRVTVPFHRNDLPKGTLQSILKQAGLA